MTEQEAKTKWCPMGNRPAITGGGFHVQQNCVGSACMAWRWQESSVRITPEGHRVLGAPEKTTDGYCGLVGK